MYLKSLVLKGFKSFADRVMLTLEPGITAVVGPNGSGKSNISDAVLWVLGERSARNLRGQAMEDIIFSGSAARKAVSIAEVDLVLDNSDHTLSVDFDEVVITRRMYRSGESEYLLNGVVSRRLDILDVLHDSGLGTGTHSIISQGSLDSILQSHPEDRRALIEEAAGVLKHKQRKEKSERKLEVMDNHLARVRDVAAEVQRQLMPLERKAKRAQAYQEVSHRLADINLAIAVDDLRSLQVQWDAVCEAERTMLEAVEAQRSDVEAAEQRLSDVQELIKRESEGASELAKREKRASNVADRLDSAEMLIRERRRAALGYEADLRASIDGYTARKEEMQRELSQAQSQLDNVVSQTSDAEAHARELEKRQRTATESFKAAETTMREIDIAIRACDEESDATKRELSLLRDNLSSGLAHVKLVEARKLELETDLLHAREEHEATVKAAEDARVLLAELETKNNDAQELLLTRFEERDLAKAAFDEARERRQLIDSEIKAIERSLKTMRDDDPALAWLLDHAGQFSGGLESVSGALKVTETREALVEALLGEDLAALSVEDSSQVSEIVHALRDGELSGNVSVVMRASAANPLIAEARANPFGHALVDDLSYPQRMQPVVEALLGDVVLCSDRSTALQAHERDSAGLRFVSLDGCTVWPTGKVRVFGTRDETDEGVLARERHLDEGRKKLVQCDLEIAAAKDALSDAENAFREAQAASLKLNQELANQKGVCVAAVSEEQRTMKRLANIIKEIENIETQAESANKTVDDLIPDIKRCENNIADLERVRLEQVQKRDEKSREIDPLHTDLDRINAQLSEAKLECATLAERRTYAERIVEARKRDIETIELNAKEALHTLVTKSAAVSRAAEILVVFEKLAQGLQRRASVLEEAVHASGAASDSVHANAASARDAAREAHNAYDAACERVAQVRVEKSRLEVQVETAVERVVVACSTPLDVAEQLPQLENRAEAEDEMLRLERRIKNMGTINPDAAEEYAELKQRYDYLVGQLDDMEAARHSLKRIVRVIDVRMKDDFVKTFEQVNANFNEIFGLLFPGGSAHLSLEDPDDVDHSGVEVTAQPRGKRLTKMMLMSGGEKSLTALALLFAVYKTRATPFYILDEVEAALDDTNLRRLISYIDTLRSETQLILITHQRRTMEMADVLFGVSMQADGVTKVISQKLERALEQAN